MSHLKGLAKAGVTGENREAQMHPLPRKLTQVLGTGLGTGYVPSAHGTAASALFTVLWALLVPRNRKAEWTTCALVHLASLPLSAWGERMWGDDPGRITIDEFAGQSLALAALPSRSWPWLLAAFLLFRVFDIFKLPFTRKHIEPIRYGIGTTLDDTIGGFFAWLILQGAGRLRKMRLLMAVLDAIPRSTLARLR